MRQKSSIANLLVKQHGQSAPYVAAERASEMARNGNLESELFWMNVVVETKVLLARDYSW
jgi:hypothetical protein